MWMTEWVVFGHFIIKNDGEVYMLLTPSLCLSSLCLKGNSEDSETWSLNQEGRNPVLTELQIFVLRLSSNLGCLINTVVLPPFLPSLLPFPLSSSRSPSFSPCLHPSLLIHTGGSVIPTRYLNRGTHHESPKIHYRLYVVSDWILYPISLGKFLTLSLSPSALSCPIFYTYKDTLSTLLGWMKTDSPVPFWERPLHRNLDSKLIVLSWP